MSETESRTATSSVNGAETGGTGEWIDRIRAAVGTVAGKGVTDDVIALWIEFRDTPAVRVTVYGPYDAGKSSLVKRLLLEDGTAVPSWLTIGARPETFVVGRETSAGIEYADTPGISAGHPEHEAAADNALGVTDALLVVLPPQLATTGVEHIRAVATGALFGPKASRLFPAGALLLAVGRMDEAGIDPQDNPDAYRRLCARKRDELALLLAPGTDDVLPPDHVPVHLVAADPYGLGVFDGPTGDWDGIAGLRADLAALVGRRLELRAAAEVRLWSRVATQALDEAENERTQTRLAAEEARRELALLAAVTAELDGVVAAARAELRASVHELLNSAVENLHGADEAAIRAEAEGGLGKVLAGWSTRWGAELDRLVRQADTELAARAQRAAATAFQHFVGTLTTPPVLQTPQAVARTGERSLDLVLRELRGQVRWVVRSLYQSHLEKKLGMSLDQAVAELGQVEGLADQRRKLSYYYRSGVGFADATHVAQARASLQRMKMLDAVLPSVLELSTLVFREIQGARLEAREAERRSELRSRLDKTADTIVDRVLGVGEDRPDFGWSTAVAEVRTGLDELAGPLRTMTDVFNARGKELEASAADLTILLERAPARPHAAWGGREGPEG
ncbi:GTPase domain-containing protein [Streptomyces sp. NPDC058613]|uniref:GTPase domain-containing protein n=1 Tax=Streptomyces sp. NPDC058613 TaxID=3346556 RepID=UPI0036681595